MKKKTKLKLNTYRIVADAVSLGAKFATNRLWKYHSGPPVGWTDEDDRRLPELIEHEVLMALDDVINFDEGDE